MNTFWIAEASIFTALGVDYSKVMAHLNTWYHYTCAFHEHLCLPQICAYQWVRKRRERFMLIHPKWLPGVLISSVLKFRLLADLG